MIEALLVSSILIWIALLGLLVVVLALARQIGVLHERIKPVGALSMGKVIKAGEAAPQFTLPSLNGGAVTLGGHAPLSQSTLLFFLSPTCPVCKTLLPILKSVQRHEKGRLRVVLASDGVEAEHLEFIKQHALDNFLYLNSREVGMAYQIAKLPYGVLISDDGSVVAHGLINNREHLDSLIEAKMRGFSSEREYRQAGMPASIPGRQSGSD
jgi:methylamine dehydrogenase accessory protein MauD